MSDLEQEQPEISKTQRKREAQALQELGKRLTAYTDQQLGNLNLPDLLVAAIAEYHRLPNSHGAKRRQLQFIGRVMRDYDPQIIEDSIQRLENGVKSTATNDIASAWLEKICQTGTSAIEEFLQEYPEADRQMLRQVLRNLEKLPTEKRPTQINKLCKYIEDITAN